MRVCVCVCERERESVCVSVRARAEPPASHSRRTLAFYMSLCVRERVCVYECVRVCTELLEYCPRFVLGLSYEC